MAAVLYQGACPMAQPRGRKSLCGFERLAVVRENVGQLGGRGAAKPAIGRKSELGQIFARGRKALRKARHVVNDAEINAGVARPQVGERREEGVIAAVKNRN